MSMTHAGTLMADNWIGPGYSTVQLGVKPNIQK